MKKLLGIAGTITISGSGMTGIVGNTLTSTKNEVNYQQTNNLEKLSRNKRSNIENLPIKNVGNWNLTTEQGYFKYLEWAIAYKQQVYKNYNCIVTYESRNGQGLHSLMSNKYINNEQIN